ncbi:MAG: hypothetical protein ACNA7V_03635 [Bacteroidales bacterium]
MKRSNFYQKALKASLLFLLVPVFIAAQSNYQRRTESFWNNWSVNLNAGMTSYYGDLSLYDHDIPGKLKYESLPGGGIIASKSFGHGLRLSGQLLYGRLKGQKANLQMQSELVEYNIHLRLNMAELFSGRKDLKFGLTGFAGLGNFMFNTTLSEIYEGGRKDKIFRSRVPEFVHFMGGGLSYIINSRMEITSELSVRMFQNDKIDGVVAGHKYDYYSYLSLGITHKINTFQPKNELRRGGHPNMSQSPLYRPNLDYNQTLKR